MQSKRKNCIRTFKTVICFALVSVLVVSSAAFTASAESAADIQKKINDTQSKISQLKNDSSKANELLIEQQNQVSLLNDQVNALQSEIDGLQAQVDELNNSISTIEDEMVQINEEIQQLETEMKDLEAQIEEKYDAFKIRLKSVYISGSVNELQVLLTAPDFSTYLSRLEMIKKIADKDSSAMEEMQEIMESLTTMKKALDGKQETLDEKKKDLEENQQKVLNEKAKLDANMDQLSAKKREADTALAESEATAKILRKQYNDSKADLDRLEEDLKKADQAASGGNNNSGGGSGSGGGNSGGGGGNTVGTGKFTYPVPGCKTVSCTYYGYTNHNGIDFANGNTYGLPVVAADSGTVITVRYLTSSYGYHVYISHGNGFVTLYAHMSQIHVKEGQVVGRGQQIGNVGNTGNVIPRPTAGNPTAGSHLHFGVRLNGSWVNPSNYL